MVVGKKNLKTGKKKSFKTTFHIDDKQWYLQIFAVSGRTEIPFKTAAA